MFKPQHFKVVLVAFVIVLPFLSGGCAFGHRVVGLNYVPSEKTSNTSGKTPVYISTIKDTSPTNLVGIEYIGEDKQKIKTDGKEIGDIRNGYYMKTASVVSKTKSLSPWITDALAKEMKMRGYSPVLVTQLPPRCSLGITGNLTECFARMGFKVTCSLKATIAIYINGSVVSNKNYVSEKGHLLAAATAQEYEKIFQVAMSDILNQVAEDVRSHCEKLKNMAK